MSVVTPGQIERYRRDGFVRIPQLISREEAFAFREAALAHASLEKNNYSSAIFAQFVNVWTHDADMKRLTLDPRIGAAATALAASPGASGPAQYQTIWAIGK